MNPRKKQICFCSIWLLTLALVTMGCGPETYHGRFLATWSPDGSRAAAVSNLLEEAPDSGLWVFDVYTGRSRKIVALNDGANCIHPQWSPFADEILFATVREEKGTKGPTNNLLPYSVWIIGAGGYGLRKIADSTSVDTDDSDFPRIALPNTVAWGAEAGTVIFQGAVGEKVTALHFDPYTGRLIEFLPHPADAYSLEPSPSRRKVAVVLYDGQAREAEVFLSDFGFGNWRKLATVGFDASQLSVFSPMIYWSPDSSCFILPEEDHSYDLEGRPQHFLRLFEVRTGRSRKIASGNPNTPILWDGDSRWFFFSGTANGEEGSNSAIFRVDRQAGGAIPIVVSEGDGYLMSWDRIDARLYFYETFTLHNPGDAGEMTTRKFFSCAADGSDIRELCPPVEGDGIVWSLSPTGHSLVLLNSVPRLMDLSSLWIGDCGLPF
ncbi:MAG TPA: hypothetical protein VE398_08270 [Acidobacteriota bacterium]|nr:hypothetical protein [Acidobacteriota bacterium]